MIALVDTPQRSKRRSKRRPGRPSTSLSWGRRIARLRRRGLSLEMRVTAYLIGFSVGSLALIIAFPDVMPFSSLMLPLLLGSLLLGPRTLPWYVLFDMSMLAIALTQQSEMTSRIVAAAGLQFVMGFVVMVVGFRRGRLGVTVVRGESMLIDLRDQILDQGRIPDLPAGWDVQAALRSAGGTPFAGDFVVASVNDPHRLEVVVVDVSGKGEEAGTRALLLSGAFGGLLGALPPEQFLPAANQYLLRQDWDEGFATAVHLTVDLCSGRYEIRTAGHPPAAHRISGSGRWHVLRSEGPILGLIEGADFITATGVLSTGDAVLMYTDGMVEDPRRDIELGIDAMLGEAESLLRGSFRDAAERLTDALGSRDDDRAMLVVHRT
ncbi:hypothetical protein GCM10027020_16800 [Nocardioides salsibiostraticola]